LSEKQFWHVLESNCAAEEPFLGSPLGGASAEDMAADTQATRRSNNVGDHGEFKKHKSLSQIRRKFARL
jgi:hypothetical protein